MDCYGQGYCMANQTCQCFSGFSGKDCNAGLPEDKNTFVTDYDLRNEQDGNNDGKEDGSDGQNGDGSNEEGNDNGENDGNNDEEEDQTVDPKVAPLEKKLAKLQRSLDRFSLQRNKMDFRKEITLLC